MNPVGNTNFEINTYWAFLQNTGQKVSYWASAAAIPILLQDLGLPPILISSSALPNWLSLSGFIVLSFPLPHHCLLNNFRDQTALRCQKVCSCHIRADFHKQKGMPYLTDNQ